MHIFYYFLKITICNFAVLLISWCSILKNPLNFVILMICITLFLSYSANPHFSEQDLFPTRLNPAGQVEPVQYTSSTGFNPTNSHQHPSTTTSNVNSDSAEMIHMLEFEFNSPAPPQCNPPGGSTNSKCNPPGTPNSN